ESPKTVQHMVRDQSQDRLGLSTCLIASWTA
ncbi:hypothetical protein DBR06_SOUSAS1510033, partial [Sousa chinensis]